MILINSELYQRESLPRYGDILFIEHTIPVSACKKRQSSIASLLVDLWFQISVKQEAVVKYLAVGPTS